MEQAIHQKSEDKIIDLINQDANGRLVVFKPENSNMDLAVELRGNYKHKPIFLKVFVQDALLDEHDFLSEIKKEEFAKNEKFYFLFAFFDDVKQDVKEPFWAVPSEKVLSKSVIELSKFSLQKKDVGEFFFHKFKK